MSLSTEPTISPRRQLRVMLLTLALAVVLMAIKAAAWWLTGSRAVLSDAAESIVNVITGGFGVYSIWLASRPPDPNHPYGHGRIEFFAAGLNGALILATAGGILREAVPDLADPRPVTRLGVGILLSCIAGAANGVAGLILVRMGRASERPTLTAEGRHLLVDTVTTVGVILGLLLVRATGWRIIDPIIAIAIACWIGWSGLVLLREAGARLMDEADPALLARIADALERIRKAEWIDVHLLRAWRSGQRVHIDFHLSVPRFWDLHRVHESQQELTSELIDALGIPGEVLVHPDPCVPCLCTLCSVPNCPVRGEPQSGRREWTAQRLVKSREDGADDACRAAIEEANRRVLGENHGRGG